MKKLKIGLILPVLMGTIMIACTKKQGPAIEKVEEESALNISSDKNLLVFESSEDYEYVVNNPSEELKTQFLNEIDQMSYTSSFEVKTKGSAYQIEDEFFARILNQDNVVQIGEYLYKVDVQEEKVYVLAADLYDAKYTELISGNATDKDIEVYGTGEDVLYLVESGMESYDKKLCFESGIGGKNNATGNVDIGSTGFQMWGSLDFNRYGIYFSLVARANSSAPNHAYRIYIQVENLWYKVKCGNTVGPYSHPWYQSHYAYGTFQKYQSYQGSKNLNGVHFKMRVRCEVPTPGGSSPYYGVFTPWIKIEANNPTFP